MKTPAPAPEKSASPGLDMEAHKQRRATAWAEHQVWSGIYDEAYRYSMPYRRPAGNVQAEKRTDHLFDNTGMVSTFRGAGQLAQDLFPPGQPFFRLKAGPVAKLVEKATRGMGDNGGPPMDGGLAKEEPAQKFQRELDSITAQLYPFFQSGEFDNAISELCLDLYLGTGIMLLLEGDLDCPIRYVTLPIEECAVEAGPYGDVGALFWKTKMSRRAVQAAFPNGNYSKEWRDALEKTPDDKVDLHQDYVRHGKKWQMVVAVDDVKEPITVQLYRSRPFIAARYYRVPGESYGRGPALLALPTIKTLNKAMELTLKAAAIQLLGIWGYRPGGSFNPNTAQLAPGKFWAMQSTGGVMGPDVVRLDVAAGKMDVSSLVLQELRTQVQAALHDQSLPEGGGMTPKSAAEIMARMSRVKANYVGAFGRMVHEIIPVVIPRAIEILKNLGILTTNIKIDQLLTAIDVTSPLAMALKADHHKMTVEAMQMVAALEGPEAVGRRFKMDQIIPDMVRDLGVESEYVRTATELAAYDADAKKQAVEAQMAAAALNKPKEMAEVLGGRELPQDQAAAA